MKLKPLMQAKAKERQIRKPLNSVCQNSDKQKDKSIDTKNELAKIAGVSHDTIAKVSFIQEKERQGTRNDLNIVQKSAPSISQINISILRPI